MFPPQGHYISPIILGSFTVVEVKGSLPIDITKGRLIYITAGSHMYLNIG